MVSNLNLYKTECGMNACLNVTTVCISPWQPSAKQPSFSGSYDFPTNDYPQMTFSAAV